MCMYCNIRLSEGDGEAMYELGVDDDGTLVGIVYIHLTNSFIILFETFYNWINRHTVLLNCKGKFYDFIYI